VIRLLQLAATPSIAACAIGNDPRLLQCSIDEPFLDFKGALA
jgi:hypothetical protein